MIFRIPMEGFDIIYIYIISIYSIYINPFLFFSFCSMAGVQFSGIKITWFIHRCHRG